LYNLARGHALSQGRNYIALEDDIPLVVKVVLSTASIERVTIFDLLLAHKGKMTTSQIANSLNISNHTAQRTMTELKALGLVDMKKESDATNSEYQITLDPEFDWFLTKEFLQLREGFVPSDNSEFLNKSKNATETVVDNEHEEKIPSTSEQISEAKDLLEEKIPPSIQENDDSDSTTVIKDNDGMMEKAEHEENLPLTTANLIPFNQQYKDKEPIFFDVFEELSNDNGNGGLVDYENLRLRLISTGKFFAGDAVLIIDYMERTGQIEETGFHLYHRKHTDNGDGSKL